MIYGGVISTPASTLASSPQKTIYHVTEGIVYHLAVIFPPGPAGLLHVQVFDATYQIFPTTIGESFSGDNLKLDWDVLYAKDDYPYEIEVRTWNLDDTYEHECSVFMLMESADEFKARYLPMLQAQGIVQAMGVQEVAKSTARRERVEAFMKTLPEGEE